MQISLRALNRIASSPTHWTGSASVTQCAVRLLHGASAQRRSHRDDRRTHLRRRDQRLASRRLASRATARAAACSTSPPATSR